MLLCLPWFPVFSYVSLLISYAFFGSPTFHHVFRWLPMFPYVLICFLIGSYNLLCILVSSYVSNVCYGLPKVSFVIRCCLCLLWFPYGFIRSLTFSYVDRMWRRHHARYTQPAQWESRMGDCLYVLRRRVAHHIEAMTLCCYGML